MSIFKKLSMLVAAALLSTGLLAGTTASAATVVGDAAINRSLGDGFNNFALGFTNQTFTTGVITSWNVWIESINSSAATGSVALLVLSNVGGSTYKVKGVDAKTVSTGLNSFTSSIATVAGDILGIFIGTAKVSYDLVNPAVNSGGPDVFTLNNLFSTTGTPAVGDEFVMNGTTNRNYSVNATVVPLPAGGLLLLTALGGIAVLRRRKTA